MYKGTFVFEVVSKEGVVDSETILATESPLSLLTYSWNRSFTPSTLSFPIKIQISNSPCLGSIYDPFHSAVVHKTVFSKD